MADILEDLKDLHKQATVERSHYYVGSVVKRAIAEIEQLRAGAPQTVSLKEFCDWARPIVERHSG
jgi:hypothetical protein